jgi:REP element-mobilizing transposase RayT
MPQPLVIAYHLIWTAYGCWLPNDPRGSGSKSIHCDILAELGALHYGRKKVQPAGGVVRAFYQEAAGLLKHPLLHFDAAARQEIAAAFAAEIENQAYTCYGCAIMPDHVHLLIRKHKHQAEEMMDCLKEVSRWRVGMREAWRDDHPVWTGGGWKVFLDHPDEVWRTIRYIERNPLALGLPVQA